MTHTSTVATRNTKSKWAAIALCILGVALLFLYRFGIRAEAPKDMAWFLKIVATQAAIYLAAVWLTLRGKESRSLLVVGLAFAALFRLSVLFAPPYLSDDIYRYVWDGRVQAAGINPYRYVPADQSLLRLRDETIYPKINRRDSAPTIYPPVAEGVFFLTTRVSESVTWMKATMVGFEAIGIWLTVQLLGSFGLSRQRVLIYAWHPLAVWEIAGSGHLDAMVIGSIAMALVFRRKNAEAATGVMLAFATLVKFFPAMLFVALYKRWSWKIPVAFTLTTVVAYLPYLSVGPLRVFGFLPGYANERGMISGEQYFLLVLARKLTHFQLPMVAYLTLCLVALVVVAAWLMYKKRDDNLTYIRSSLIIASFFMVLLSPHFPWYFVWLLPLLCFVPSPSVFYLTLSSFLLYLTWLDWSDHAVFRIKALIFLPFFVLLATELWRRRHRRSSLSFSETETPQLSTSL